MRWDGERPDGVNWNRVLENLATRLEEHDVHMGAWAELIHRMRTFAEELDGLPAMMQDCGVDEFVIARRAGDIGRLRDELRAIRVAL